MNLGKLKMPRKLMKDMEIFLKTLLLQMYRKLWEQKHFRNIGTLKRMIVIIVKIVNIDICV